MIAFMPYSEGPDRSKLNRAWEKYYEGLPYNKKLHKVRERVRKGKIPVKKHYLQTIN